MDNNKNPNYLLGQWLSSAGPGEEVVISGLSGQFPNSHNVYEFRDNLFNKIEMVDGDDRRWNYEHREVPLHSGKIYDIKKIDAGFFGLHYRQANSMDPTMRTILESAIEAVMDAGVNPAELEGTKTGVFVSVSWSDPAVEFYGKTINPHNYPMTGFMRSVMANRISYCLKLKGPSFNVDTACSSSAHGVDTAFRAIRHGNCDRAIVTTCNLVLDPRTSVQFFRLGVLSYEGHCRVFDQDASGYVRSETVASVFLQKAKDSRRIYAQIVNTKANCDGFKNSGITFPSMTAQKELMSEIYSESGLPASDITFVEAHGTGTQVGDIQEVEAIDSALAKFRTSPLLVGSVKSSIGHTEPCSGIAAITKIVLAMETNKITPNINLKKIKEGMKGFEEGRMIPVVELTDVKDENAIMGVNNFGFGGANAHMILRRVNKVNQQNGLLEEELPKLVCVSGRTPEAIFSILDNLNNDQDYIALLQQLYKTNFPGHLYRGFTIVNKTGSTTNSYSLIKQHLPSLYLFFGNLIKNVKDLARGLLAIPIFKTTIKKIDEILKPLNLNVMNAILKNNTSEGNLIIATAVQFGIAAVLVKLKLKCIAVYANSIGKLVADFYSNKITLNEAIIAAVKQSRNVSKTNCQNGLGEKYENCRDDFLDKENLGNIAKSSFILNVSDADLGKATLRFTNAIQFLEALGRLYVEGFNFQIHNLYPKTEFPVHRGTAMLSPFIKWNHKKNWYAFKFDPFSTSGIDAKSYSISYFTEDQKFIKGHVIDGRNLIPATEYLMLVWETFAYFKCVDMPVCPVVFENCKFLRATAMQKAKFVKLYVVLWQSTGRFEVLENEAQVVEGKISFLNENLGANSFPESCFSDNSTQILKHDEIYKELYLRGYNYSGLFKAIEKYNIDGTSGLIKWQNNFTAFMDNMLQLSILQTDSRLLFVPVVIKKIILDPIKHLKIVENSSNEDISFPVHISKANNVMKSGGITISGIKAKSIARKPQQLKPVLEKYEFIPNRCSLDVGQVIRVNTQIILENTMEINFKAVELIDEYSKSNSEFLLPLVCQVLDDLPLVNPMLTVSTKQVCEEIPGINIEHVTLKSDSNLLLIVGSNLLQRYSTLQLVINALSPRGFVLSRESLSFDYDLAKKPDNILELFTEFTTATEKIILLKKREQQPRKTKFIEIDESFKWLNSLQTIIKEGKTNIVMHAKNGKSNGTLGLVNCIRREPGGSRVKFFLTFDNDFDFNLEEYSQKTEMSINIFKNHIRGTYRHLPLDSSNKVLTTSCFVNNTTKGDLSSLKWLSRPLSPETPLLDNQVLVYTFYSALNFRDIMMASGRIGPEVITNNRLQEECLLGFEFSGKDPSGRKVCGIVDNNNKAISTMLVADANFLWNVPNYWTMEDAATFPVVYATVVYALLIVAKMKRGSSILIHSAAGGIGLAAINVCRYFNCEIFVTVGTQEKRDYIKQNFYEIDDDHIGNSRDVSFEEMIHRGTNGRGVDIVLNSLAEEKLKTSVRCLAHGGYFLEIGKFDLANDNSLELLFLEREINYHGVMLDRIYLSSDEIKKYLHKVIDDGIRTGFIKPLPRIVFKMEEVEPAFRYMTKGKHIGKVLIKIRDENEETDFANKTFKAWPRFNCDLVKSYVIIGGLGGFGLELADWLVLRGARKLVLSSRNGIQTGYQRQRIEIWKSYGVTVQIVTRDITTEEGCIDVITKANVLGPVDAVFNLAVVLQDALIHDQTEEMFKKVLAPKAKVTQLLDDITRKLCPILRYFVVFSSVSCGRGNIGQSNYGLANSIMERICEKRKSEGLPALAIQWGAIGEVGLVAKMQKENKELVIGGTLQQKISSCFEVLDKFLTQNHPIVSSMLVAAKTNRGLGIVSAVEAVAQILGINNVKTVSQHSTLPELGMDSMMGTEAIQVLEKDFDIYITAVEIRHLTFAKLTQIEAEKKETESSKTDRGANFLIQFIPDNRMTDAPLIVKMQSQIEHQEEGPIAFVLPGIEGMLISFEPFVKKLRAHVYGIQYSYRNPEDSIEDFANNILQHVEPKIEKDKTFIVIAHSFGVDIGLEILHLLESKGCRGRFLAIDGSPTYLKRSTTFHLPSENETEFETILLYKILQNLLSEATIAQNKDNFLKCQNMTERANFALTLIPPDVVKKLHCDAQGAVLLYKRIKAVLNYEFVHPKIKSVVHLLKAKIPLIEDEDDYGFTKICEKPVDVAVLDGTHSAILDQVQLIEIANKFIE